MHSPPSARVSRKVAVTSEQGGGGTSQSSPRTVRAGPRWACPTASASAVVAIRATHPEKLDGSHHIVRPPKKELIGGEGGGGAVCKPCRAASRCGSPRGIGHVRSRGQPAARGISGELRGSCAGRGWLSCHDADQPHLRVLVNASALISSGHPGGNLTGTRLDHHPNGSAVAGFEPFPAPFHTPLLFCIFMGVPNPTSRFSINRKCGYQRYLFCSTFILRIEEVLISKFRISLLTCTAVYTAAHLAMENPYYN